MPFLLGTEAMKLMKGKIDMETKLIELMNDKFQCEMNEAVYFVLGSKVELDDKKDMHVFHVASVIEVFRNEKKVLRSCTTSLNIPNPTSFLE